MSLSITADKDVAIARALMSRLRREIARMIKAAARHERFTDLQVTVRLCSDSVIRRLSSDDACTDARAALFVLVRQQALGDNGPAGDIVINFPSANREAKLGLHTELLRLCACGLCQLLGYAPTDEEAERAMHLRAAALRREAVRYGHIRAA